MNKYIVEVNITGFDGKRVTFGNINDLIIETRQELLGFEYGKPITRFVHRVSFTALTENVEDINEKETQ